MKTILRPKTGNSVSKLVAITLLVFFTFSCNDFFVKEDFTIVDIQDKKDLDAAAGGIKDLLSYFMLNRSWFEEVRRYGNDINIFASYSKYYKEGRWGNETDYFYDVGIEEIYWGNLYEIIVSVNNVMNQYDKGSLSFVEEKQPIGEILFTRAYCYYLLVRLFGRVPIVNDIDIDEKLPKATYNEIYSFIETDLLRAYGMVSKSKSTNTLLTIDQACVKAMLAEVYLSWAGYPAKETSKYAEAVKTAKGLLDSAAYFNLAFIEQFKKLWADGLVNTSEDVFCYYTNSSDLCQNNHIPYSHIIYKSHQYFDNSFFSMKRKYTHILFLYQKVLFTTIFRRATEKIKPSSLLFMFPKSHKNSVMIFIKNINESL